MDIILPPWGGGSKAYMITRRPSLFVTPRTVNTNWLWLSTKDRACLEKLRYGRRETPCSLYSGLGVRCSRILGKGQGGPGESRRPASGSDGYALLGHTLIVSQEDLTKGMQDIPKSCTDTSASSV